MTVKLLAYVRGIVIESESGAIPNNVSPGMFRPGDRTVKAQLKFSAWLEER